MTSIFMKQEFAIIYGVIALAALFFTATVWKHKDAKAVWMKRLFVLAIVIIGLYSCYLFINTVWILNLINTIVFTAEGWLLYFYYGLCFVFVREGSEKENEKVPRWPLFIMILDSVGMIGGIYHEFSVKAEPEWVGPDLYVHTIPSSWFLVHLAICYGMIVLICYILMKKAATVSKPYALAYWVIMVGLIVVTLINACYIYNSWRIDISILLYAVMGELLHIYLYHFKNQTVQRLMKNYVVDNVDAPILFFDMDNHLSIFNEQTLDFMQVEEGMELKDFIQEQGLEASFHTRQENKGKRTFSLVKELKDNIFLAQGKELYDEQNRFVGTLFTYYDITREEHMKDEATYTATHDKLTGLWNREFFFEMARKFLRENPDVTYYMIATDIDNFKMFNAILGKKIGDDLLVSIAECCRRNANDQRLFGRMGADRFAVLIPKEGFSEERFIRMENEVFSHKGFSLNVKNYNGVCEITDHSIDPEILYDWAYMALESIKGNVKADFAYFDESLKKDMIDEALTADEMMEAMKEKQFVMFLQPQIDSSNGAVVGAEALARWDSPKRGMVSPAVFIPFFEENGLITYLDYYIWEQACMMLRKWQDEGLNERSISINISAKDFYLSDLFESITGLVRKYGIDPAKLKLEITETAIVLDIEEQMALVKRFQDYGFLIEMDDFGSGYSSLNSLKNISVDILKLDMKFLGKASDLERSQKIIKYMVELSHSLNMPVVAEGVETKEQLDFLQSIGCNIVQGFYYAMPMPILEFEDFMKDRQCVDLDTYIRR